MATESVNFALPVGRIDAAGDYTAMADRVDFARDLRQVAGESAAEGLEITIDISADATLSRLYAMFDGTVTYDPKSPKRLRFAFGETLVDYRITRSGLLERLNRSCEQLKHVIYDDVNSSTLKSRLSELIQQAYKTHTDHPTDATPRILNSTVSMKVPSTSAKKLEKKRKNKDVVLLAGFKDLADEAARKVFADEAAEGIVTNGGTLSIGAGDCIGDADIVEAGKHAKFAVTLQDGTSKSEQGNLLNPVYVFHLIARKRTEINFAWPVGTDDLLSSTAQLVADLKKKVHPLLMRLSAKAWGPFKQSSGVYTLAPDTPPLFVPSATAAPAASPAKVARTAGTKTFHGYPVANPASKYEWRLADDLYFKYRSRTDLDSPNDADEAYFTFDLSSWTRVLNTWKTYGKTINGIAAVFNAPCEVLLAFATHESGGSERACGLEQLKDKPLDLSPADPLWKYFKLTAIANTDLPAVFDWADTTKVDSLLKFLHDDLKLTWAETGKVTATTSTDKNTVTLSSTTGTDTLSVSRTAAVTVTTINYSVGGSAKSYELPINGDKVYKWLSARKTRLGRTAPQEADFSKLIESSRSADYTWQKLVEDLNAQQKLWERVSPGLSQTLVSTAINTLQPLDAQKKKDLGLTLPDLTKGGEVFKWLLEAKNSLAVGTAYKVKLNTASIGFDLPMLASAYNSGSVKSLGGSCTEASNPFNLCFAAGYMLGQSTSLAPLYNAAIRLFERYDLLDGTVMVAPAVRFS